MKDLMITNKEVSITSLDIVELLGSRHDTVKKSIERLAKQAIIVAPPLAVEQFKDAFGRRRTIEKYVFSGEQGKRDSIIVVAQLSPEFTAALVDRWKELEEAVRFKVPTTFAEALQLAADQAKEIEVLAYERDEAIKTKAQIGSKREASAMARASAEARKAKALEVKLDQSREYASIKKMEIDYGGRYDWRLLKNASVEAGLSIKKAQDVNYGEVNSYHKSVWKRVYNLEIK